MVGQARARPQHGGRNLTAANDPPPRRVLLVFLDGVGLGVDDADRNPLAAAELPTLRRLIGGARLVHSTFADGAVRAGASVARPIDATLGVSGRPQSGTGQAAILIGTNTAELLGRHFGPWVPTSLRDLLTSRNLFRALLDDGRSVAFANAYPEKYAHPSGGSVRRPGAFPFAAQSAGVLSRHESSVRDGSGLVSSITTERWRRFVDPFAPAIEPDAAGRQLARITAQHDFVTFAHYDTDLAGHQRDLHRGITAIARVDRFLAGLVGDMPPETLLLLTSDHGNLEDVTVGHTLNPVPLIASGPGADHAITRIQRISDAASVIRELLGMRAPRPLRKESPGVP